MGYNVSWINDEGGEESAHFFSLNNLKDFLIHANLDLAEVYIYQIKREIGVYALLEGEIDV